MALRIIVGLALTVVAFALAGRRLWWLYRVGRAGQPARSGWRSREHPAGTPRSRPPRCSGSASC